MGTASSSPVHPRGDESPPPPNVHQPLPVPPPGTVLLPLGVFILFCLIGCSFGCAGGRAPVVAVRQMSGRLQKREPSLVVMMMELRERFQLSDAAQLEEVESAAARELAFACGGFDPDHTKNTARRIKAVWVAVRDAEAAGAAEAAARAQAEAAERARAEAEAAERARAERA